MTGVEVAVAVMVVAVAVVVTGGLHPHPDVEVGVAVAVTVIVGVGTVVGVRTGAYGMLMLAAWALSNKIAKGSRRLIMVFMVCICASPDLQSVGGGNSGVHSRSFYDERMRYRRNQLSV